ncbi:endonuclease/exonuclease/phosphatase family protein [Pseudonocardia xishanensis]|uniref:Endonuclease/exonuclease/phosphatase family protein n=1 Tax=Pseudonocardia xishanensis TaxID=630995 RepID=A0ABP8S4K4_9PSEU
MRRSLAVLLGAGAAAAVLPDRLGLDRWHPFPALAAVRPQAVAGSAVVAGLLSGFRSTRPAAAAVGAVAALGAAGLAPRLVRRSPNPAEPTLTVLAANVWAGRADAGALATLIARERPDLVSLPESGVEFRDKLMPLLDGLGYRSWVSTEPGRPDAWSVTVLASGRMGELEIGSGPDLRHQYLRACGGLLGDRAFYAVHPQAPMARWQARTWRRDLASIARWTAARPAPIVAGDFNATLDHAPMRACLTGVRDAAEGTGRGLTGTYHAWIPRWAGIRIDHVLIPRECATTRYEILDLPGSDHRAVLVGLASPA